MRISRHRVATAALLVLGMAGLIFGIVYLASPHEPSYHGKTLSEWIAPFCRQTAKGLDAPRGPEHFEELQPVREAVRQIGTNGLPFLIARLNNRELGLHRTARGLLQKQPIAGLRLTDPNVSKVRAIRALANLGPAAEPAIPSLAAQLSDATLSEHAVYALSGMGAKGMRALVEQYTNVPAARRIQIAQAIVVPTSIYRGGETFDSRTPYQRWVIFGYSVSVHEEASQILADVLIEGLALIAKDRTSPFQTPAIQRLGGFGPRATTAVPILVQILNDRNSRTLQSTILALGKIRSQPEVVVPALSNLLSDTDPRIFMSAASALREFGYDVPSQPRVRPVWPLAPGRTNQIRYY